MTNLLEVKNLGVNFNTQAGVINAVNDVSFRIQAGSTVAIVGESGSGKSVTAQAIMGILPRNANIDRGNILFNDQNSTNDVMTLDIAKLDPNSEAFRKIRGNRISMIFQEPMTSLSPLHTIGDQISEALLLHRNTGLSEAKRLSIEMLQLVGFPNAEQAYNTYPFELSGGLRQRAMISMALVCRPSLLIADEPSTALDVTIQAQILKQMKDLQKELGMAVLMITHDLGVVANVADEVVVAYHGRVMESGTVQDIFGEPKHPYLKALLKAVPHFKTKERERLVPIREIKAEAGQLLLERKVAVELANDQALLTIQNISKNFNTRKRGLFGMGSNPEPTIAVNNVSFEVRQGECLGLVGESGCGKTTLSKMIMRAIKPDDGQIMFNDNGKMINLHALSENNLIPYRRKIQYIFQDPFSSLNPRMTVFDILSEPLIIHNIGDDAYRRDFVKELMSVVGLDPRFLSRYPHSFSGGQRQRIGIARSLALKPDLILCDEPVSALDVSVQAQILNLLKDLQKELGLTYIFISHNLAVVDYIADRIAVMCAGQLVEVAPRELLFKNPSHPYTQALVSAVPSPDPQNPLNFDTLMEDRASVPSMWPHPFTSRDIQPPPFQDLGHGHLVRAHEPLTSIGGTE